MIGVGHGRRTTVPSSMVCMSTTSTSWRWGQECRPVSATKALDSGEAKIVMAEELAKMVTIESPPFSRNGRKEPRIRMEFQKICLFNLMGQTQKSKISTAELNMAIKWTGGHVLQVESFGLTVFKESYKCVVQSCGYDLGPLSKGILGLNYSLVLKVHGIIDPSIKK